MAEQVKDPKAPGWKPDPSGRFAGRFWNGTQWTEHVVNRERVTSKDPIPYPPRRPSRPAERQPVVGAAQGWPTWARIALPLAIVAVLVFAVASRGNDKPSHAPARNPSASSAGSGKLYAIGESATTGDFKVTVFGATDPQTPGPFLKPATGKHLVSVDVEVANPGSRSQSFSSLLGFHLLDSQNHQFDTSFGEIAPEAPDGDVPPGEARRGFVVFAVPDGTTGLRLRVQGTLTAVPVTYALS